MTKTRVQTQRPAAKGRHQKPNRRWSVRENPPSGINWGSQVWPGAGAGTITPFAQWVFDTGLAGAGILSGEVRFDNATLASVTHVYVSKTPASGADPTAGWAVNDPLRVYLQSDMSKMIEFKITAVSSQTGYFDYTVTVTGTLGGFTLPADGDGLLLVEKSSAPGADPQMPGPIDPSYDVGAHTIADVQAYVNGLGDPADAAVQAEIQRLVDAERAGQNRVTLVTWLDAKLGVI